MFKKIIISVVLLASLRVFGEKMSDGEKRGMMRAEKARMRREMARKKRMMRREEERGRSNSVYRKKSKY